MDEGKRSPITTVARVGSLTWKLQGIEPGCFELFAVPDDRSTQVFMQYLASGISRSGLQGQLRQTLVLGIEVSTRRVIEIVKVERDAPPPPVKTKRSKS